MRNTPYFPTAIIALLLAFSMGTTAHAKEQVDVDGLVMKMKSELNLTQQQTFAVKKIIKETMQKKQEIQDEYEGQPFSSKSDMKAALKKMKQNEIDELSQILTPEQMQKWVAKETIRAGLNKDKIDGLGNSADEGVTMNPSGATMQF